MSTLKTPGFVYFAQGEDGGPVKIGWAVVPAKRIADMQSHSPVRLKLLGTFSGDGKAERALHVEFAADRLHGEWFRASPALLDRIRQLTC